MSGRKRIKDIRKKHESGLKLSMITAYDAFGARQADEAGIDMVLVGDSLGNTFQGRADTLAVEMSEMLYHTEIVARVSERCFVIGDMPFGSYQVNEDAAVENAIEFLKCGAQAVKLEGGEAIAATIKRMTSAGVPVMGHLGFTPQSTNQTSGPRLNKAAEELLADAQRLVEAGVFSMVLEMVPTDIAKEVTEAVTVPTIGIGAGPHTSGQVLVYYDMLGFDPRFSPKFLKRYFNFHEGAVAALKQYKAEVEDGTFPGEKQSY